MYTQGKSANTSVALCFDMFVTEHNLSMNIFVLNTHNGYRIEYYFKTFDVDNTTRSFFVGGDLGSHWSSM